MLRVLGLVCLILCAPSLAFANAGLARLVELLDVDSYIEITRQEGLRELDDLSLDMIGRPAGSGFVQQMDKVYDTERMRSVVLEALEQTLDEAHIAQSLIFWDSAVGARISELELAARMAISDPEVETAARLAWVQAAEESAWLVARIDEITELNDLVERNVTGALNSNFQFYQGLADGGGLNLSEAEMLNEVWGQEEEIRVDTAAWLGAYQLLAYQPLEQSDIEAYLGYWQTQTGQALNRALFDSFNVMYDEISYATGRVIALNMGGQDL